MEECVNCEHLEQELRELRKKVQELEEKANQNSSNSHKPPSSDFGAKRGYVKRKKSGRKRGGQPGHAGKSRELLPVEKVGGGCASQAVPALSGAS